MNEEPVEVRALLWVGEVELLPQPASRGLATVKAIRDGRVCLPEFERFTALSAIVRGLTEPFACWAHSMSGRIGWRLCPYSAEHRRGEENCDSLKLFLRQYLAGNIWTCRDITFWKLSRSKGSTCACLSVYQPSPLFKEATHRGIAFHADRDRIGVKGFFAGMDAGKQICTRRPIRLVLDESRVTCNAVQFFKRLLRTKMLGDCESTIDSSDG